MTMKNMQQFFFTCLLITSTNLFAADVCRVYEFAELNTYKKPELIELKANYDENIKKIIKNLPGLNPFQISLAGDQIEICKAEIARLSRIIESKPDDVRQKKSK